MMDLDKIEVRRVCDSDTHVVIGNAETWVAVVLANDVPADQIVRRVLGALAVLLKATA